MIVLAEGANGEPVTLEFCQSYATSRGIEDLSLVYMDPTEPVGSWGAMFAPSGSIDPGGDGSIGLPWSAVLRGADMKYVWRNTEGGTADQVIGEIIGQ